MAGGYDGVIWVVSWRERRREGPASRSDLEGAESDGVSQRLKDWYRVKSHKGGAPREDRQPCQGDAPPPALVARHRTLLPMLPKSTWVREVGMIEKAVCGEDAAALWGGVSVSRERVYDSGKERG